MHFNFSLVLHSLRETSSSDTDFQLSPAAAKDYRGEMREKTAAPLENALSPSESARTMGASTDGKQ